MTRKVSINLLPPELAGKAGKARAARPAAGGVPRQGPNPLFVLIALIAFALAAYGLWTIYDKTRTEERLFKKAEQDLKDLEKKVAAKRAEFQEFIETRDLIMALSEVLDAIDPPNRIIWAEKLVMLADLVPENVYVTSLKVVEKERQVITEESKRAIEEWEKGGQVGPKPEEIKKPIIHQEVTISALCRVDQAREVFDPILLFLKAMQSYTHVRQDGSVHSFMENFVDQPTYGEIKQTTYDGVNVYQFNIYLKTKPLSAQVEPESPPAAQQKPVASARPAAASAQTAQGD
ncbi:MAG: hypothetical protein Kow0059_00780 [Candidatus Sumerlaeia bacterium]